MKKALIFALILSLLTPAGLSFSKKAPKDKKTYVAKTKKGMKHKKRYKKRYYIRKYPYRANTSVSGDKLKLEQMLKDIYE
ncbi:MAG: hypothetical protein GXO18_03055 [Aquificae bacterium]|nr:hypothetical protein [Aquificota bacterium]